MSINDWDELEHEIRQPVPVRRSEVATSGLGPLDISLGDLLACAPSSVVRASLGGNPMCPPDLLAFLACDTDESVRTAVGSNPSASLKLLAAMSGFNFGFDDEELRADPILGPVIAARAGLLTNVSYAVVRNPVLPTAVLESVVAMGVWQLQVAAADHPGLTRRAMAILAASDHWRVRRHLAGIPDLPAGLLNKLSRDADDGVRRAVAWNENSSRITRERLARDEVFVVRTAATGVGKSPGAARHSERLYRDWVAAVMGASGSGWHARAAALAQLEPEVAQPVVDSPTVRSRQELLDTFVDLNRGEMERLSCALAAAADSDFAILIGRLNDHTTLSGIAVGTSAHMVAARHPLTPKSVVATFLGDANAAVRSEAVARIAPDCHDAELLAAMALDDAVAVRVVLAACAPASMPAATWKLLASDKSALVADAVAKNPNSSQVARALVALRPNPVT